MKLITVSLIALMTVTLLTACETRTCLKGHLITTLMPVFNGKTTTVMPHTYFHCDLYEQKETE